MGYLLLALILGYLLGSFSSSYLFTRLVHKTDIRDFGSGNAGATNVGWMMGPWAAVLVFLLDLLKGVAAVYIGRWIGGEIAGLLAGIGAVLGHNYPVWLGFRGGNGAATTGGVAMALSPLLFLFLALIFVLTIVIFKYVGLGSIVMVILLPFLMLLMGRSPLEVAAGVVLCALLLLKHHSNIRNMLDGTEVKIDLKTLSAAKD